MAKFTKPATAIVVMGAIIAVLLMLCTPRSTSRSSALDGAKSSQPAPPPRP
jgi:hypothetical protein